MFYFGSVLDVSILPFHCLIFAFQCYEATMVVKQHAINTENSRLFDVDLDISTIGIIDNTATGVTSFCPSIGQLHGHKLNRGGGCEFSVELVGRLITGPRKDGELGEGVN